MKQIAIFILVAILNQIPVSRKTDSKLPLSQSFLKDTVPPCGGNFFSPTIQDVQLVLKKRGYYRGVINGKMNKKTIRAINNFRKELGLPISDGELFRALNLCH
jgi:peptidoglycan hydrolase-like protein with peptidoglycan-binding domain